MVDITKNVKDVLQKVHRLSESCGREIFVVGATKTRTAEEINVAIAAGLEMVGENRAQEFRDKLPDISPHAQKHFIGPLQQNKIKYVVGRADLIHSCDSLALAQAIDAFARRLGTVQDVLLEVNIGGEQSKHGFTSDELTACISELTRLENVRLRGLMTVLPMADEDTVSRLCVKMKELFDSLSQELGEDFIYLSMGMSEDYALAISCGANMVRLGRAIFGERGV